MAKRRKTKREHIEEILAEFGNDIGAEQGMKEMRKRKVPVTKSSWYSAKGAVLKKQGAKSKRGGGKRRRATTPKEAGDALTISLEVQVRLLEEKNAKLKAALAALM